jgi:hypothetical protein
MGGTPRHLQLLALLAPVGALVVFIVALGAGFCDENCYRQDAHSGLITAQLLLAAGGVLPVAALVGAIIRQRPLLTRVALALSIAVYVAWAIVHSAAVGG